MTVIIYAEEIKSYTQRYSEYLTNNGFLDVAVSQRIHGAKEPVEEDVFVEAVMQDYKRHSRGMKTINNLDEIFIKSIDLQANIIRFKIKNDTLKVVCLQIIFDDNKHLPDNRILTIEAPYSLHKHLLLV